MTDNEWNFFLKKSILQGWDTVSIEKNTCTERVGSAHIHVGVDIIYIRKMDKPWATWMPHAVALSTEIIKLLLRALSTWVFNWTAFSRRYPKYMSYQLESFPRFKHQDLKRIYSQQILKWNAFDVSRNQNPSRNQLTVGMHPGKVLVEGG